MDLIERVEAGREDVSTVPREEVLRYWLAEELEEEKDSEEIDDERELLRELVDRKPLAEWVFEERDREWYHVDLDEEELRALTVVKGESGEGWRSVAEDGRIESVARGIEEGDDLETLNARTEKDLEKVVGIAHDLPSKEAMEELIVVGEPGENPWIADGNHRAVARVLHAIEREEHTEQIAYVGVGGKQSGG